MTTRLALAIPVLLMAALGPRAVGQHLATEPADGSILPMPATVSLLCITPKWLVWQTHELIQETAQHRAQGFAVRFYRQRRGEERAELAWQTEERRVRWKGTALDDGTLLLHARHYLSWVLPDGTNREEHAALGGELVDVLTLHPDGVVVRNGYREGPVRAWFVPIREHALALEGKVDLTDEKGFRFTKPPTHYKIARHGDELMWSDDVGLHIVNIVTGARREVPLPDFAPIQAFDGESVLSSNASHNLRSGETRRFDEHFVFVAVRNGIGYAVKGLERSPAYQIPKRLALVAVELSSGHQRTLAEWPNADISYLNLGPMNQAFDGRVKWDYAPQLYTDEPEALTLWDGTEWRRFKWLTRFGGPATQPTTSADSRPSTQPATKPAAKPIAQLIQDLTNSSLQESAKNELGARGKPAVPALVEAIKSPDFAARDVAVISLGMIRDPETVPFLIQCLADRDWHVQGRAAYALSGIGGQQARDALVAFLKQCVANNSPNLTKATEAMKELPDSRAFSTLLGIVQEAAGSDRGGFPVRYAAEALGKIGDSRASPVLVRLLRPETPYSTSWDYIYLEAIKQCKGREALPGLVKYLEALVDKMKKDSDPASGDSSMKPIGAYERQVGYNTSMYLLTIECLEAITSSQSQGTTREQSLKFWKEQAAQRAKKGDLSPASQPATLQQEHQGRP